MPHPQSAWSSWRLRRQLTQARLADVVGVETSTITHIENGRRAPSVGVLVRICDALDLGTDERVEALRLAASVQPVAGPRQASDPQPPRPRRMVA